MSAWISSRTGWSAPAVVFLGCATTGTHSYDSMHGGADSTRAVDSTHAEGNPAVSADPQPADSDAVPDGPVLDRSAYVRAVLRGSRSIESARQAWRAAIARVRQAGTFDDPMLTLEIAPLSIGSSGARLGWSGMVSQRLPWPGKLALEETVSKAEADAQRSDYEAARRELALTASLLFDEYFVVVRSIEINAHHVDLMRSMHAAAIAQFEAGRASAQDPLQAEFELTHMEHDTIILASERDVTVARMNELLHRDPELPLPPPPGDLPPPNDVQPAPAEVVASERLETEAMNRRPDIAGARQRARAEQAQAERSERESYPDVTVSTSYNSMWDTPEHRWMVGLSFNLPVQTGRRQGAVEEANARRAEYEAEAARMSDMARTQVVVAVKQLEEARHVLHIFGERLLPIARQQVDAARAAFISSQVPFGTLIDAEKNLRAVELDQRMAEANYDRRRGELDRALGRIPGLDGVEDAR
jgi:cobalt-zinc-cadmium efflux system outer membrane protein